MPRALDSGRYGFDDFFAAIAQQESGGDYSAVNGRTGASGRFQIMPGNIGPWSQQYLGRRISVAEFRSNPQLQDKLARAVLSDYYQKYGARGAAAAWYSGKPGRADDYTRFRSNEPSVGEYVDQVLGKQGNAPKGGTSTRIRPVPADPPPPLAAAPAAAPLDSKIAPGLATPTFDTLGRVVGDSSAADAAGVLATAGMFNSGGKSDPKRDRIIAAAMQMVGTPYVWGGTSRKGVDCSGLIKLIFGENGIDMPRISADQARYGTRTDLKDLRPGDLVAFDNSTRNNGADHIAIYAGGGQIIEAPRTGLNVRVRKIGSDEGAYGVSLNI